MLTKLLRLQQKLWTDFKAKVQSDKKEKRDREVAELEKNADFQQAKKVKAAREDYLQPRVYKKRVR